MAQVIVVTSGKGGVGKTTAVSNIATGLALEGKKAVMVDMDIGLRNLDVVMGLENRIVYDIVDVVERVCKLKQALVKDKRYEGLCLLPASQTREKNAVSEAQMKGVIDGLRDMFEFIIIDCPAGIEHGFKNAVSVADEAIIVTAPEVSAVRDADRVLGLLSSIGLPTPKLIINRIRPQMVKKGEMMDIKDITDILCIETLGIVPDSEDIIKSTNIGSPIVGSDSFAGLAYKNIVKRMLGEEIPMLAIKPPGFFGNIASLFSKKRA